MVGVAIAVAAASGSAFPAIVAAKGVLAVGATTGAITGALSGATIGIANVAAAKGATGAVIVKSAAAGGVASAIIGSVTAGAAGVGPVSGSVVASVTGAGAAGAVSTIVIEAAELASGSGAAAALFSGPVGWLILGAEKTLSNSAYTFHCWKQVLHDDSCAPSNGKLLNEIVVDKRVKRVIVQWVNNNTGLPQLVLQNVWDEQFRIDYVFLPFDQLAAHAVKI